MKSRDEKIYSLLLNEIASKSLPPAIIFGTFSILVFFYRFNLEIYKTPLRVACVGVLIASIMRAYIARTEMEEGLAGKYWKLVRYSVWLNTLCWSVIFGLAAWELKATGLDYVIAMIMLTSFVTGSLITLSYDKWIFFPFQILLLGPQCGISIIFALDEPTYYILAFVFFGDFLYQVKQYIEYKKLLMKRFSNQIELEVSYDTLQDQTVKLIQASKAAALGEMSGGLSHEVNNSLMVILGSLQQLERNMKHSEDMKPEYEIKIKKMVNGIQKIKTVTDGLRYFSRQMEAAPREETDLDDIIQRTLNFSFEMVKAHKIDFEIGNIPRVKIYCHPIQITQVLFNLIKNSYDAMEKTQDQSHKWLKLDFMMLGEDKVRIKLCNGGPKISPEVISRIFQPFFTTKDVGEGTGLSLSISNGIIKEHGGKLYLDEDEPNTTFVIELPCRKIIST